jgi:hypothetical protein
MTSKNDTNSRNQQSQQQPEEKPYHIEELRQIIDEQAQRISYLESVQQEYREFKGIFAGNGNLTYYDAMNRVMERQSKSMQIENDKRNFDRQQKRYIAESERQQREINEALARNPTWLPTKEKKIKAIQENRDKAIDLANQFYNMTQEQARQYTSIRHDPSESAIQNLINEYIDSQNKFMTYECKYCHDESHNLSEFESHAYLHKQVHRDATLNRIRDAAFEEAKKINEQFEKDIYVDIRARKDREVNRRIAEQRAEQRRMKDTLPYVKR